MFRIKYIHLVHSRWPLATRQHSHSLSLSQRPVRASILPKEQVPRIECPTFGKPPNLRGRTTKSIKISFLF